MKNRANGFTFLELMLALVIVAIVAGAIFGCLQAAFKARDRVLQAVDPIHRASLTIDFLRRDMESALPPTGYLAEQFIGTTNANDSTQADVYFSAAVDGPNGTLTPADIRQIEYTVLPDPNDASDHVLVRRVYSNTMDPNYSDALGNPDDEIVCRGVLTFNIEYYDGTQFNDTWDSTAPADLTTQQSQSGLLPVALQVTLDLKSDTPGAPPVELKRLIRLPCCAPATQPAGTTTTGGTP